MVIATPAYQTAYQSVRLGPIKQVLRRTLNTLSAAAMGGRILADTEEVTGSNPVSPTSIIPGQLDCVQFRFMLDHRVLVAV